MKKIETEKVKINSIYSAGISFAKNIYDRNEYLGIKIENEYDIYNLLGNFLIFSSQDFNDNLPLNYVELYKLREKILAYYGNNFSIPSLIYIDTIEKPEMFFDIPKFFTSTRMTTIRFTDDFIYELINGKTMFPENINQYKYVTFLDDLLLYMYRFITVKLDDLISHIYMQTKNNGNSIYVFSKDLLEIFLESGKTTFTVEDIKIAFSLCEKNKRDEDKLIDIAYILPEDSYHNTLKSVLKYSKNFDDEELKENFKSFCSLSLFDDAIFPNLKHFRLSSFIKSMNKSSRFSKTYINKGQISRNNYINLYIQNRKPSISVDFEYNEDLEEHELFKVCLSKLIFEKEKTLSEIDSYLNICSDNFNALKDYLRARSIYDISIVNLYDYHIFLMGSNLCNTGFVSTFFKKSDILFRRSMKCFTDMAVYFVKRRQFIDVLKQNGEDDFKREVMFATLCCQFYNLNFNSRVHFIEFFRNLCDKILDRLSYNLPLENLFNSIFPSEFYSFSEVVCYQIEIFFECSEFEPCFIDDIEEYFAPSSLTYQELSDNILSFTPGIHSDVADLISLQFLISSVYFKSYTISFNCTDRKNLQLLFHSIMEKAEEKDIQILRGFKHNSYHFTKYNNSMKNNDLMQDLSELLYKLSPNSLNKLRGTILDIQVLDDKIYEISGPSYYNKLFYSIPDTNKLNQFKTFSLETFIFENNIEVRELLNDLKSNSYYETNSLKSCSKFLNLKPKKFMLKDCYIFNPLINYMMGFTQKDKISIVENISEILKKIRLKNEEDKCEKSKS